MTRVCTAEIGRTQRFRKINLCVLPISAVFLLLSALSCQAARISLRVSIQLFVQLLEAQANTSTDGC